MMKKILVVSVFFAVLLTLIYLAVGHAAVTYCYERGWTGWWEAAWKNFAQEYGGLIGIPLKKPSLAFCLRYTDLWVVKSLVYAVAILVLLWIPRSFQLSVISLLLLVLVFEGGLRVYESYWHQKCPAEHRYRDWLWTYDEFRGWKLKPNHTAYFGSPENGFCAKIESNSKGLREEEIPYEKQEGLRRILLLGDSETAGFEVQRRDVIDSQLEKLVLQHGPYEVINAATRGYGTDQSYLFLKEEGYRYQPDIVIYLFSENDVIDNVTLHKPFRKYGKSAFVLDDRGKLVLEGVPVPERFEPFGRWRMTDPGLEAFYNEKLKEDQGRQLTVFRLIKCDLRGWKVYQWIAPRLKKLSFISEKLTSSKIILKLPNEGDVMFAGDLSQAVTFALIEAMRNFSESIQSRFLLAEYYQLRPGQHTGIQEKVAARDIPYVNLWTKISPRPVVEDFLFPFDRHWNAKGHHLMARALYESLKERNWI
ncbi:MAG: SGNH/GDSL hydrolase family protein [Candidatus Omnitrophica bacterium]|nr:SGNH/GDSL hydrolase family protein [Candidatus Omnitrophota bacterium]